MTPPDPQQVAEIAGRLSKAQREAVRRDGAWSTVTARKLAAAGLLDSWARLTGENWVRLYWNDTGLAVRNFIQGNHHD